MAISGSFESCQTFFNDCGDISREYRNDVLLRINSVFLSLVRCELILELSNLLGANAVIFLLLIRKRWALMNIYSEESGTCNFPPNQLAIESMELNRSTCPFQ